MTHFVPPVPPSASLEGVAHLLGTSWCDAVVVDARGHLSGIITVVDLVAAVAGHDEDVPSIAW